MNFNISFCPNIIFQNNILNDIGIYVSPYGKKILFFYGASALKKNGSYKVIVDSLKKNNIEFIEISGISDEPAPELIDKITYHFKEYNIDAILAVGGGSVIDTAKAVAALIPNESGIESYLEGIGSGKIIQKNPLPVIAVPTTAGSGAEVTKNAVITNYEKKYKKSFRDSRNIPRLVLADSSLTLSLSKEQTAAGGMDALCQLIESYISVKKNPYCMAFSAYYIPVVYNSLITLISQPANIEARSSMLQASIASGLCLANSGLGIVHGFASGIGGMFKIPHGLICAVLLPHSILFNMKKNKELYYEIANMINGNNANNIDSLAEKLFELNRLYEIPERNSNFIAGVEYERQSC